MNGSLNDSLSVLLKIGLLSAAISIAIKFLPFLEKIPETSSLALALVLSPSILMAGLLAWRSKKVQE
ncbi:hypothetical protein [Leptolyngbya sp. FACHB-711]|jgi:hypothetical protein|uniref:hypothetical protein n=1 Tax=unclassified Leptolyngbya TaxID=2650499 RepID=UPI0016820E2E|nr:hypothetical protein [Leptolyngbya sp. FACHB-711]MBD1850842.1 hypothetical protein [Cyanobacteria bacterium FACHB-502]MBD2027682.1 hypothetical protein [Leptolyngbya sp. FACHB-711]